MIVDDIEDEARFVRRSERRGRAQQFFTESPAADGWADKQPRHHRELGLRPSGRFNQLRVADARDNRHVAVHRAVIHGDPCIQQPRRAEPSRWIRRPPRRVTVLTMNLDQCVYGRGQIVGPPIPHRHPTRLP
jgi:hypothetical protein